MKVEYAYIYHKSEELLKEKLLRLWSMKCWI